MVFYQRHEDLYSRSCADRDVEPSDAGTQTAMMRRFIDGAEHIYLACGATDFRKQIPGLSTLVRSRFHLDPF